MGICPNKCLVHSLYRIGGRRRLDLARISSLDIDWRLDMDYIRKPEPEVVEEHPAPEKPEVKEKAPVVEEKAPATEQPERVIINEAKLREIFNSKFMHEWVSNGKMYLDQVIEDLQFVRDNYVKGAKQDEAHFASKHIIEIASILHKDRYFRRVYNSFMEWCCTLFECLSIEPPKRENIKNPQEISNQVKKRFFYLL